MMIKVHSVNIYGDKYVRDEIDAASRKPAMAFSAVARNLRQMAFDNGIELNTTFLDHEIVGIYNAMSSDDQDSEFIEYLKDRAAKS